MTSIKQKRKEFEERIAEYRSKLPNNCQNCGSIEYLDIHHIVPLASGGTNRVSNMAILCSNCHGLVHDINLSRHKILQKKGIAAAKATGKHLGRPKMDLGALNKDQRATLEGLYPSWKNDEITAVEFMTRLDLKKNTFYKIIKEYEAGAAAL